MAVLGFVLTDAAATLDGAKWQLARRVERSGYAPATIDGGYEWFGYHQADSPQLPVRNGTATFWQGLFTPRHVCALVRFDGGGDGAGESRAPEVIATIDVDGLLGPHYRLEVVATPKSCAD